jgi:Family of unknown function (DUF5989)
MEKESFTKQFRQYMKGKLRYLLIPMFVLLALFILVLVLTQGSNIGQFIYNFF